MQQMTQQLDEERSNQAILKFSIQKWQRIVEKETGEPISKWTSNMDGTGWKGRAQQITILKAKISALESKLFKKKDDSIQPCVQESIRLAQEKRRAQFAATLDENTQLKEKIAELTRKLEGLQARNHFLCLQEGNLKQKLQLVIQKATKDDHLIQLLQKELNYWKTSAIPATSQPSPKKSETRKVSSPPRPILDFTTPIPATAPTLLMSERERYESELQQLRTKLRIYQNEIQVLKQTLESVQEAKEEKWIKYLNDSQSQNFQIPKLAI
ncbi:Coiled-coil domain-containing protein 13 [Coelomomyces lativittatus]|nr:Coiled-coil domain-containing protein 13 [Coelomomyces lativittatus]